jgi:hypothetical protein
MTTVSFQLPKRTRQWIAFIIFVQRGLSMVAHTCCPSNLESRDRDDQSLREAWAKVPDTPSQSMNGSALWHTCNPRGRPGLKARPHLKINQYKKAWQSGSVIEHLSSRHKVLSSNTHYCPSPKFVHRGRKWVFFKWCVILWAWWQGWPYRFWILLHSQLKREKAKR